jgi:hypothetical protein
VPVCSEDTRERERAPDRSQRAGGGRTSGEFDARSCRSSTPACIVLASGTSGTSSSAHCGGPGGSALGMATAAALTQRLMRASSFRKRLRRFHARRSGRLTAAKRRRSIGWEAGRFFRRRRGQLGIGFQSPRSRVLPQLALVFVSASALAGGASRPHILWHIPEGSGFSELYAALGWVKSRAARWAPYIKCADSTDRILASRRRPKMPLPVAFPCCK